jgi:hypothetical protein
MKLFERAARVDLVKLDCEGAVGDFRGPRELVARSICYDGDAHEKIIDVSACDGI